MANVTNGKDFMASLIVANDLWQKYYGNWKLICLYPINIKTVELIGPKFFVAPRVTPGKIYG